MNEHDLRDAWVDVADDQTLGTVFAGIERRRHQARATSRRRAVGLAILSAFTLGLVCTGWVLRPAAKLEPLRLTEAPLLAGELAPGPLRLDDASVITPDPGARLAVIENSGARLQLSLHGGRARFEVTPNTGRQWRVLVGELTVEVVGTVFTIDRGPSGTRVSVERGVVQVSGERVPGQLVRLEAGQSFELSVAEMPSAARLRAPEPASAPVPDVKLPPVRASTVPTVPAIVPPAPPPPSAASKLLERADVERRAGQLEQAKSTLASLIDEYPSSPEAGLGAFTLGRIHEEEGELEEARRWFSRALTLGLPRPLEEAATTKVADVP